MQAYNIRSPVGQISVCRYDQLINSWAFYGEQRRGVDQYHKRRVLGSFTHTVYCPENASDMLTGRYASDNVIQIQSGISSQMDPDVPYINIEYSACNRRAPSSRFAVLID